MAKIIYIDKYNNKSEEIRKFFIKIEKDEFGCLYSGMELVKILPPGIYFNISKTCFIFNSLNTSLGNFGEIVNSELYLSKKEYIDKYFLSFKCGLNEIVLYFISGKFIRYFNNHSHYFIWKGPWKQEIKKYDTTNPLIENEELLDYISKGYLKPDKNDNTGEIISTTEFSRGKIGILYVNNKVNRVLEAGIYHFWKYGLNKYHIDLIPTYNINVSIRHKIITADKITVTVSIEASFIVSDPLKCVNLVHSRYDSDLESLILIWLIEFAAAKKAEELLTANKYITELISSSLSDYLNNIGVTLLDAAIVNVHYPRDIRNIINKGFLEDEWLMKVQEMLHVKNIAENIKELEFVKKND